jgi:hypothetical protein
MIQFDQGYFSPMFIKKVSDYSLFSHRSRQAIEDRNDSVMFESERDGRESNVMLGPMAVIRSEDINKLGKQPSSSDDEDRTVAESSQEGQERKL